MAGGSASPAVSKGLSPQEMIFAAINQFTTMHDKFNPIAAPPDWSAEKDLQEFIDRFGEADDYFAAVRERMWAARYNLNEALDLGLRYFYETAAAIAGMDDRWPMARGRREKREHFQKAEGPTEERRAGSAGRWNLETSAGSRRSKRSNWPF